MRLKAYIKKSCLILSALLYLISTSGFSYRVHYCMGHFSGIYWQNPQHPEDQPACPSCGMEEQQADDSCCTSEYHLLKIDDQQVAADEVSIPLFTDPVLVAVPYAPDLIPPHTSPTLNTPIFDRRIPPEKNTLYLLHRRLLI